MTVYDLRLQDQMRRLVDLEGKLKFDSLILKKQALSEVPTVSGISIDWNTEHWIELVVFIYLRKAS